MEICPHQGGEPTLCANIVDQKKVSEKVVAQMCLILISCLLQQYLFTDLQNEGNEWDVLKVILFAVTVQ